MSNSLVSIESRINLEDILSNIQINNEDIIYLGGSIIEGIVNPLSKGMGNKYSDVDVFIIRDDVAYKDTKCVYSNKIKKTLFYKNFDVEIFNKNNLEILSEKLNSSKISSNEKVLNAIEFPEGWDIDELTEFLNRIKYSYCIKNEDEFNNIKNKFDFKKYIEIMSLTIINIIENNLQDIYGNIDAGELETALICTREMSFNFMKFILLQNGELCDRRKWLWKKIENLYSEKIISYEIFSSLNTLHFKDQNNSSIEKEIKKYLDIQEKYISNKLIDIDL